mgnify:CR=1 FL=1
MKKAIFIRNGAPAGFAHFEGDVAEFSDKVFDDLNKLKFVKEHTEADIKEPQTDLPADLPAREVLIEAGLTTLADLHEIEDYSQINGIGKGYAKKIAEYLKK